MSGEATFVKWLFDGEFGWSAIGMLGLIGGTGAVLAGLLGSGQGGDPPWKDVVYCLVLAVPFVMTFVFASRRPFAFSVGFRRFTLSVWVLAPVLFFCWGWLVSGPYEGVRDERVFVWMVSSVSAFMLVWMAAVFPYTAFMLWRRRDELLPSAGRRWIPRGRG